MMVETDSVEYNDCILVAKYYKDYEIVCNGYGKIIVLKKGKSVYESKYKF